MKSNTKPEETNPFDVLMDAAVDAIIIADSKGNVLRFNRAAQELFLYSAEEIYGRNVSMLMSAPHRIKHDEYMQRYRETDHAEDNRYHAGSTL